ncbi:MAG TPA: reverse transcriptase family protein [Burkholderiales bacterium]|nr:reverse transcriptase family protein [Burkholderiales bacterium]
MQPILSVRDLSSRLRVKPDRLREIARDIGSHYKDRWLKKGSKSRRLSVPDEELKEIQRRINSNILSKLPLGSTVYGGVRGGSPRRNAGEHVSQPYVVNMDVKEFFPNVRHYMVYRMFRHELGFGKDVASLLTRLTTYRSLLPQGAPTSTAVANLLLASPVDIPVAKEAERLGLKYSRFVDDIAISGPNPRPLINAIAKLLSRRRLPIHRAKRNGRSKLRITGVGRVQMVTGLIVNSPRGLSVPRARRESVRAAVWALRRAQNHELKSAIASIRGRVAYIAQFNRGSAKRLNAYLASALAAKGLAS